MPTKPQCHLNIIFAREAHQAVIFRRGPTIWTELILWNTGLDTFTKGQWFKGNLYTERSDISPDGTKLVYFAAKQYKNLLENTWTAISRPPYFTALAMWPDSGTWSGGGYFEDNSTVRIRWSEAALKAQNQSWPEGFTVKSLYPEYDKLGSGSDIYYNLLLEKRGWLRVKGDFGWNESQHRYEHPYVVLQKHNPDHSCSLLWTIPLSGPDLRHEFKVLRHQVKAEFIVNSSGQADWDQRGRLIYSDLGRLFRGHIHSSGIEPELLAEFTANQVRLIQSPAWARTWDQEN